jgi:hypothetical protein
MREARDSDSETERGEGGANCYYQDGGAEPSSGCGHDTNDEGNLDKDDNDEEPRPAKRRKRHL